MNKTLLFAAILIIVVIGAFVLTKNQTGENLSPSPLTPLTSSTEEDSSTKDNAPVGSQAETPAAKPKPKTVSIIYGINGYIPSQAFINLGDTVNFNNLGKSHMWPASDNYPNHELYPEFDSKAPVPPGQSWSFTFSKAGVWNYHDHVSPTHKATITVKE